MELGSFATAARKPRVRDKKVGSVYPVLSSETNTEFGGCEHLLSREIILSGYTRP